MMHDEAEVSEGELWHVLTELLCQATAPSERVWWLIVAVRAVDEEFLSPERTRSEPAGNTIPPVSEEAEVTLEKICKPIEFLEEARARLGDAAKGQSDFLEQQGSISRALTRFRLEVERWPADEQARIVEGARRDLERERQIHEQLAQTSPRNIECAVGTPAGDPEKAERWLGDNAEATEDAKRDIDDRPHKIDQMQDLVDAAHESPEDSRNREDLIAGARQRLCDPEDRHQATPDAIAKADRGKTVSQEEAERVLSTPMRIKDLFRDAVPQEWELMTGGGFIAAPTQDTTLIAAPSLWDWHWSVHVKELAMNAHGRATDPARAVATAEAVHWLLVQDKT